MKPYRSTLRASLVHSVFLTILIVLIVQPALPRNDGKDVRTRSAGPIARLGRDPLSRSGFEHFYNTEYDKAIRDFEQEVREHPDDAFAVNHLTTAVLFKELYRIGALDTELFANNSFMESRHFPPDPKVRARVRELNERALQLCERRLRTNEKDTDALYARGVARATRSLAMGLLDKSWFSALRNALGARHDHERVLELDPNYSDAKMVVGVHYYVVGSLPWTVKAGASLLGISGSKQKGIEYLYDAIQGGGEASVDARTALALFLRREQRYAEAIALVGQLMDAYPRNFLVALEMANLLKASGRGDEAIASYRKLLDSGKQGQYVDPRLEQAAYGLGEALRGYNDYAGAAEAYEMVSRYPKVDPELLQRATLAAGQMYDLLSKRELAIEKYQQVIREDQESPHAAVARKYLKQAYRGPKKI
jgi:tetratricopeptide (TPR) repeat protein